MFERWALYCIYGEPMPRENENPIAMSTHSGSNRRMYVAAAVVALILVGGMSGGWIGTISAQELQRYPTVAPPPLKDVQKLPIKPIPLPDLTIASVTSTQAVTSLGSSLAVTITTRNIGTAPASGSDVMTNYYLSTDQVLGNDIAIESSKTWQMNLTAGAETSGWRSIRIDQRPPRGAYYILACADSTNRIGEVNEQNNCAFSATRVQVEKPDLVVAAFSTTSARVVRGGQIQVTDTVRNIGPASLKIYCYMFPNAKDTPPDAPDKCMDSTDSIPFRTVYYLSLDNTLSSDDVSIGHRLIQGDLAAGAQNTGTLSVTIPLTTLASSYYLIARASAYTDFESDTGNNWTVAAQPLVVSLTN